MRTRQARLAAAAAVAAAVLVVAAAGCGGRGGGSSPTPSGSGATVGRIAIVTPEKANDFGWNQQGVAAVKQAATRTGATAVIQDGAGYGDIAPMLEQLSAGNPGLIVAWASGYNTVAPQMAREHGIPTLIVGAGEGSDVRGLVADVETNAQNGAYLAGILAARTTRSGTLAIVVSAEDENWTKMSGGFIGGARSVTPAIRILYVQIGQAGYADAAGGQRVTEGAIAGGADVIFGMGDGASFGMLRAVETATPPKGADKLWFVDVIGDKSPLDKQGVYLSSVVWDFTPLLEQAVHDIERGSFGEHTYWLGLDNGIGLLHSRWIPAAVWSELEKARRAIMDGSIKVPLTKTGAEVKAFLKSGQ